VNFVRFKNVVLHDWRNSVQNSETKMVTMGFRRLAVFVPMFVLLWNLILFVGVMASGTSNTHDPTDQKQKFAMGDYNNDSPYSVGYKYLQSGIHSRSVGNIAGAISLLQKAVEAYKVHLADHQNDETAQDRLADALYQLADTFSLMSTPTADNEDDDLQQKQKSRPYYQQALDLYAKLSGRSAKLRWAHCLTRLGVLMMEQHSTHLPEQVLKLLQKNFRGEDWNEEEAMEEVMNSIDVDIPKQAIGYFSDAAAVFRSNLEADGSRVMLATSLQNMAVAMTHVGRVDDAIAALEEAIGIYEPMVDKKGFEVDTAQGMAEAFYSLADLYLQNGSYEMAKDRYRRSSKFLSNAATHSVVSHSMLCCSGLL
jgi:tetratricopeptide (TPR) repeat protein